jgi:hypothetical protein
MENDSWPIKLLTRLEKPENLELLKRLKSLVSERETRRGNCIKHSQLHLKQNDILAKIPGAENQLYSLQSCQREMDAAKNSIEYEH